MYVLIMYFVMFIEAIKWFIPIILICIIALIKSKYNEKKNYERFENNKKQ